MFLSFMLFYLPLTLSNLMSHVIFASFLHSNNKNNGQMKAKKRKKEREQKRGKERDEYKTNEKD